MSFKISAFEGDETAIGDEGIPFLFVCANRRPGPELLRNGDLGFLALKGDPCPSIADGANEEMLNESAEDFGIFLRLRWGGRSRCDDLSWRGLDLGEI